MSSSKIMILLIKFAVITIILPFFLITIYLYLNTFFIVHTVEGSHTLNGKRVDVKKALTRDSAGRVITPKPPRDNWGGTRGWGGLLIFNVIV